MRHLLIAALTIVVVLLLFQQHRQSVALASLQRQQATAANAAPSLELQERCAKQAAAEFKQEGLDTKGTADFVNHYSAKLGRCFVVTRNTEASAGMISTQRLLVDAYEGRIDGTYLWINSQGKKYWEVSPTECSVTLPSGDEKKCESDDEWNDLAKAYMEAP